MLAFDDGWHDPNGGFVVAQAAPLESLHVRAVVRRASRSGAGVLRGDDVHERVEPVHARTVGIVVERGDVEEHGLG